MNKELEALEQLKYYNTFANDDFDMTKELDIIETALKRLEELEKAFHTLSKEDEKTKKLLSLEIEKNRALEIIKENLNVNEILLAIKGVCKASDYDLVKEVFNGRN